MIRRLSDILLLSDLDGTLFDEPYGSDCLVSEHNRAAVARFIAEGGHFAIASGRAHPIALGLTGDLKINFPSIFVNGGYIYDVERDEVSCRSFIDKVERARVAELLGQFGPVDAAVFYSDLGQFPLFKDGDPDILAYETHGDQSRASEADGVYKYMIFTRPERQRELYDFLRERFSGLADVTISADTLTELLPIGVSKAYGVRRLLETTGWDRENVVAVGDYYNDLEMLEAAEIAVAMGNAPDEVKTKCDICVKSCREHGVADLIERLEAMYL